jgi:hypothetical protein
MSKHAKMIDFFTSLQNAEALKQFQADPDAAMAAAGLSDEEKALVKRGDQAELRTLLGDAAPTTAMLFGNPPAVD